MTPSSAAGASVADTLTIRRPRGAVELWDAAVALARARFGPLIVLSALMVLVGSPAQLARTFVFDARRDGGLDFVASLYEFAVGSVVVGAMTVVVSDAWHGRPVDVARAVGHGMRRALPLMVAGTITSVLVLLLSIFLVVPGMIAASRFFAVGTVIMLEDRGVGGAFRRSVRLSRGNMPRLLGTVGVATMVSFLLVLTVEASIESLGVVAKPMATLLTGIVTLPIVPFLVALSVVTYLDVRIRQEAYDLEVAVDALG